MPLPLQKLITWVLLLAFIPTTALGDCRRLLSPYPAEGGAVSAPATAQSSAALEAPASLSPFTKTLWNFLLAQDPTYQGAMTLGADIDAGNGLYAYGLTILSLRELTENPTFKALAQRGADYRVTYWMEMVSRITATGERADGFRLNPFYEILASLHDFEIAHGLSGIRSSSLSEAERKARSVIERRLEGTGTTFADYLTLPINRVEFQSLVNRFLNEDVLGGAAVDFESWKLLQLRRIDEICIANYRRTVEILINDFDLEVGFHRPGALKSRWDPDRSLTPPPPVRRLTAEDAARLEFRIVRPEKAEKQVKVRIEARLAGESPEFFDITVHSPVKGNYLGDFHFLPDEYAVLTPAHPYGLVDLLYHVRKGHHFKYDLNISAIAMTSDVFTNLDKLRERISGTKFATRAALEGQVRNTNSNYRSDLADSTPERLRMRLDNQVVMDKWFNTWVITDFMWYGYSQSTGFRHWENRDQAASLTGKPVLREESVRKYLSFWQRWRIDRLWNDAKNAVFRIGRLFRPATNLKEALKTIKDLAESNGLKIFIFGSELHREATLASGETDNTSLEKNQEEKREQVYRLDQPFAGEPLPLFIDVPSVQDLAQRHSELRPVQPPGAIPPDFVLESVGYQGAENGLLALPSALEFQITSVRMRDSGGKDLVPGQDFQLRKVTNSGVYLIRIVRDGLGDVFQFITEYKKVADVSTVSLPPTAAPALDPRRLHPLVRELQLAGATVLAQAIESLLQHARSVGASVSVKDLEQVFKDASLYSFEPAGNRRGAGRFSRFSKFLNDSGVLCYQCDAANQLFTEFLNAYYDGDPLYVAERRATYRVGSAGALRASDRHSRTFVFVASKGKIILDATPARMDPRSENRHRAMETAQRGIGLSTSTGSGAGTSGTAGVGEVTAGTADETAAPTGLPPAGTVGTNPDGAPVAGTGTDTDTGTDTGTHTSTAQGPPIKEAPPKPSKFKALLASLLLGGLAGGLLIWLFPQKSSPDDGKAPLPPPAAEAPAIPPGTGAQPAPQAAPEEKPSLWGWLLAAAGVGGATGVNLWQRARRESLRAPETHPVQDASTSPDVEKGEMPTAEAPRPDGGTPALSIPDPLELNRPPPPDAGSGLAAELHLKLVKASALLHDAREKMLANGTLSRLEEGQLDPSEPLLVGVGVIDALRDFLERKRDFNETRNILKGVVPGRQHLYGSTSEMLDFISSECKRQRELSDKMAVRIRERRLIPYTRYSDPIFREEVSEMFLVIEKVIRELSIRDFQ